MDRTEYARQWWIKNRENAIKKHNEWVKNNPEKFQKSQKKYRNSQKHRDTYHKWWHSEDHKQRLKALKIEVFTHYCKSTPKCMCCNESEIDFQTIEHVRGKKNYPHDPRKGGNKLIAWLKNNNYPTGYEVLCYNCNCARGMYGSCH